MESARDDRRYAKSDKKQNIMSLTKVDQFLAREIEDLKASGRAKRKERIITGYVPAKEGRGPRYQVKGSDQEYIRMNSNSYLDLSHHPAMKKAADEATHDFGVGPGAVRFIDGTFEQHIELENKIAAFSSYPSAKIFNSAYTANLALALSLHNPDVFWIGDELNHNSIIRSMRISNVPRTNRAIYRHNDMDHLRECLEAVPASMKRVHIIFDGIFSMRGDHAPMAEIAKLAEEFSSGFEQGVITIVDDSHGIAAYGETGRGTQEYCQTQADIAVGTFGKGFGVNGGYIAASPMVIEAIRQKADTYIYTNPLSVADCAAAIASVSIVDSEEGKSRLIHLQERMTQFRNGLDDMGLESIAGPHPVIPILIRDSEKTHDMVSKMYDKGVLLVGLTFPVVPAGSETIRCQMNAGLTESDVRYVLDSLYDVLPPSD